MGTRARVPSVAPGSLRARTLRIEDDKWQALDAEARRVGLSTSEFVRRALDRVVIEAQYDRRLVAIEESVEVLEHRMADVRRAVALLTQQRAR